MPTSRSVIAIGAAAVTVALLSAGVPAVAGQDIPAGWRPKPCVVLQPDARLSAGGICPATTDGLDWHADRWVPA